MESTELRIDVSDAVGMPLSTAATGHLPDGDARMVIVATPGGGYSRRYFDLQRPGYSQALHHTANGVALIACDHVGVGDSDQPTEPVSWEAIAAAGHQTALKAIAELGLDGIPTIGIGQSYGGLLLNIQQARHRTYAAIGVLGYSAIHTVLPVAPPDYEGDNARYYGFHWEDVPADFVAMDLDGYPDRPGGNVPAWSSPTMPGGAVSVGHHPFPLGEGAIAQYAAQIDVPVLIANGERDVCPDPHAEPLGYPMSNDITVFTAPRMAHMHNFAGTRELWWNRLLDWATTVVGANHAR